jgi:alpha-L-fucosidase
VHNAFIYANFLPMKRRTAIKGIAGTASALWLAQFAKAAGISEAGITGETVANGLFKPSWDSLKQYTVPDWFKDAKFGMWAHWGPQCQPEHGDWYARGMYQEGSDKYKFHVEKYGHPSKFGFKDVINEWKAENWDPDELVGLYKRAGAQYFFALANHHDNFDLFNSKYQSWNSTKQGPKKDLIGGWAKAAKAHGLRFGVSVHASHTWRWMESVQLADKSGAYAGVPYDGNLTPANGKGLWWEGLDPQELYAQHHPLSTNSEIPNAIGPQWAWGNGAVAPSKSYCEKFLNRTIDLINKYEPDLVYFDDTALPLWPVSDVGLRIATHLYNSNMKRHNGKLEAVLNGKILTEEQQKCMVWDIERGQSNKIEPYVWQTDTCIGDWHYDRRIYEKQRYKSAKTVIHTLADVVSKNGNLLLNIPVRGDGTIDELERTVVEGVAAWMNPNGESIFGTRPWKVFGEGPAIVAAAPLNAQGFNEGKGKPFTSQDIRFTTKGDILYAIALGKPADGKVVIKSLSSGNAYYPKEISRVELVSTKQTLNISRNTDGLTVTLPDNTAEQVAYALKVIPA